jgi:predicted enzyme related to lactoylglutathione lyase
MRVFRTIVVLDAPDLDAESSFWAQLLDGTVEEDENWRSIVVDGEWRLGIQYAPDHVPPVWPGGDQQQQIHLDLWVDDLAAAHERALGLGARLLQPAPDPDTRDEVFQVYADPAGHPFCLCRGPLDR